MSALIPPLRGRFPGWCPPPTPRTPRPTQPRLALHRSARSRSCIVRRLLEPHEGPQLGGRGRQGDLAEAPSLGQPGFERSRCAHMELVGQPGQAWQV